MSGAQVTHILVNSGISQVMRAGHLAAVVVFGSFVFSGFLLFGFSFVCLLPLGYMDYPCLSY